MNARVESVWGNMSLRFSMYITMDGTHIVMNEHTYNRTRMKKDGA